jgi:hypothetical protein
MILILLALIAIAVLIRCRHRQTSEDIPAQLLRLAVQWLPAERAEWADALTAELTAVTHSRQRWQFALSTLRVTLLPPSADVRAARRRLAIGVAATAAAGGATRLLLPSMTVFVTLLFAGMTAAWSVRAARADATHRSRPHRAVIATALAGIIAVAAIQLSIAIRYPAATGQPLHPLTVLLAVAMPVIYLAAAAMPRSHARSVWLTALACVGAATCTSVALMIWRDDTGGVHPLFWPPTVLAWGAAWIVTWKATGSTAAGRHAALLTAALTAATQLTVATMAITVHEWAGATRSSAAGQVEDALSGQIITNIIVWPTVVVTAWLLALAARPKTVTQRG